MIVLDASAMVELLLRTPRGLRVRERLGARSIDLHAPCLIDVEVAHVLRRLVRTNGLSSGRGAEALEDLRDLEIARYPHEGFLRRIWLLRDNLTAYDAAYIVLSEALGAPLLTCDSRLASAPGHHATIELV